MSSLYPHLLELLEDGSRGLPGVTSRRMFGCDALFAYGNIYALIWDQGRIGLKLPEKAAYDELAAQPGTDPWRVPKADKPMSHWLLVPESFHDEPELLGRWVRKAHDFAAHAPPKRKPAPRASNADKAPRATAPRRKADARTPRGR